MRPAQQEIAAFGTGIQPICQLLGQQRPRCRLRLRTRNRRSTPLPSRVMPLWAGSCRAQQGADVAGHRFGLLVSAAFMSTCIRNHAARRSSPILGKARNEDNQTGERDTRFTRRYNPLGGSGFKALLIASLAFSCIGVGNRPAPKDLPTGRIAFSRPTSAQIRLRDDRFIDLDRRLATATAAGASPNRLGTIDDPDHSATARTRYFPGVAIHDVFPADPQPSGQCDAPRCRAAQAAARTAPARARLEGY